ncbi:MAG TPA: hypothetical protein VIG33_01780 [Pseudobdellovibrionaceae bacterium]
MKSLFFILIAALSAFANAGELDGMTFCRKVETGGMFGQPKGTREHCVSFKEDVMTDNANTFFGNPPECFSYTIENSKIINSDKNSDTGYEIQGEAIVVPETGAVLTLKLNR